MTPDFPFASREERERFFTKLLPPVLLILVPTILGLSIFIMVKKDRSREQTLAWLRALNRDYSVFVSGREVSDGQAIVQVLKTTAEIHGHHSHPINPSVVEIRAGSSSLRLTVARDSDVPDEYWIFVPGEGSLGQHRFGLEIGRVKTNVFSQYSAAQGNRS